MAVMIVGVAIRFILAFVEPPSFDLQNIGLVIFHPSAFSGGPWTFIEAQLVKVWLQHVAVSSPNDWGYTPPFNTPQDLMILTLMMRLPAFIFDIATLVPIYYATLWLSSSKTSSRLAAMLWIANPYTVFAIELLGVPDIAATFLALCACLLLVRGRPVLAGLSLFAGVALKLFPIMLLPALLIEKSASSKSKYYLAIAGLIGLGAYLAWAFPPVGGALMNYTPLTQPISILFEYALGSGSRISAAASVLIVLYFATWWFAKNRPLITGVVPPLFLVYYALSDPYPSYFLWVVPFLVIDIAAHRKHSILFLGLLTFLMGSWLFLSHAFSTPSGYSLLLIPLRGTNVPWYSQLIYSALLVDERIRVLIYPFLAAGLYATSVIYALEFMRGWFSSEG